MRKLSWLLALLCCTNLGAMAGPNVGGVLWVHDTGIVFSSDTVLPPVSVKPANCGGVDNQQPADNVDRIWKVYAAFPPGNSPRLKGTAWSTQFPDAVSSPSSYVTMNAAGCGAPDEDGAGTDFWLGDLGFPTASGGQVGQSFPFARLTTVVTLFYFTGAGYAGGAAFPTWCTGQHSNISNRFFLDDAVPQNLDPIMGYGCLGFGTPGTTPCPTSDPDAACCAPDGTCTITKQANCPAPSVWHPQWYVCTPNPCPVPTGACCYSNGLCQIVTELQCLQGGGTYQGNFTSCNPNPCPVAAACCLPSGSCLVRTQSACAALNPPGVWHYEWPYCTPNPCPQAPAGACCASAGTCAMTTEAACLSPNIWHAEWPSCTPNPCPPPPPEGACCDTATGACTITTQDACLFSWMGAGTVCDVTTCPPDAFDLNTPPDAYQGELIDVAVMGSNSIPIAGYSINFTFDSVVFEFVGSTLAGTRGEGAAIFTPGHSASAARAGVVYDFSCDPPILAGSGPMLIVTLRVKLDAPAGGTDLVLQDQSPSLNRMSPCGGGTIVPILSSRAILVLPLPTGACCDHATGDCVVTAQAACPFDWLGAGVPCNTETCPPLPPQTGACCDHATGDCVVTTQAGCPFDWLGAGVPCNTETCSPPPPQTGACCDHATGDCVVTTQAACPFDWLGAGVPCNLETCVPPVPTERASWGRIKNRYR
jgi:hypothetical protein